MYDMVLPGIIHKVSNVGLRNFWDDWLRWGHETPPSKILKRDLKVTIGDTKGAYFGEWAKIGEITTPSGRGALVCKDKLYFGFTEKG